MHAIPSVATAHQRPLAASAPSMWRRSRVDLSYPVFESLDPLREGLTNVPGVVVLWDAQTNPGAGVPGRCIYVGQSRDLAAAVALLRDDAALAAAAAVGLRITWRPSGSPTGPAWSPICVKRSSRWWRNVAWMRSGPYVRVCVRFRCRCRTEYPGARSSAQTGY